MNINNYSQFYKGTTSLTPYASGAIKVDTLVKYEFDTTDKDGNKVMDKMTREETMKALNDISSQYGENVVVQFSGDGLAAFLNNAKGAVPAQDEAMKQTEEIKPGSTPLYADTYGSVEAIDPPVKNYGLQDSVPPAAQPQENISLYGPDRDGAVQKSSFENMAQKLSTVKSDDGNENNRFMPKAERNIMPDSFAGITTKKGNNAAYLERLKAFQINNPMYHYTHLL